MRLQVKFIATACFLLVLGCQPRIEEKKAQEAIPVRVQKIKLQDLAQTIEYVGDIKAQDEAVVYPKVTGKIVQKTKEDGAPVEKGSAIAYIDRDEVGLKFEKAPVESPIKGIVGRVYVDIGANVTPQTPIALVVSMEKVKISLDVPEKYLAKISLTQKAYVKIDAYSQEEFSGEVTKISPVVDLQTRSAPVEITVDNPDLKLKSGMFAQVYLVIERHPDAVMILKEAVVGREPEAYVYLIKENKAVMKKITQGITSGPYVEVTDGVSEGDMVAVVGQQRLFENAPVTIEIANGNGQGSVK